MSVYDARGRFVGRVDGMWRERGDRAEADGAGSTSASSTPDGPSGAAAARLVLAEKVREDRLRAPGWRWSGGASRTYAAPRRTSWSGSRRPGSAVTSAASVAGWCPAASRRRLVPLELVRALTRPERATPEHEVGLTGGIGP